MRPYGLNQNTLLPARPVRLRGLDPDTLADWLEEVIPHLSNDQTLPFLGHVHIRLAGGRVAAFATDRYTGAIATLPRVGTGESARFTIPGDFARRAVALLRAENADLEDDEPVSVDLTITGRVFGLTVHYTGRTRRLAARIDPHGETLNLPRVAADALDAPPASGTVHVNTELLARFLGYGIIAPFDPATGHLLARTENLLARYAVHNTGRVLVLTRPDYLGFIATCLRDTAPAHTPTGGLAATRAVWRETLAAIA